MEHWRSMSVHHCIISAEPGFLGAPKKAGAAAAMVRMVLAEGLAGFLQRGGVDTAGIVRRFQRSRSDGSNHHAAGNAAAAV